MARRLAAGNNALHVWSRDVLGDLQKRARILKLELEEIRRLPLSRSMIRKELTVKYKLERLEEQIDVASRQRAHADWLSKGDCNTKYFQVYASE